MNFTVCRRNLLSGMPVRRPALLFEASRKSRVRVEHRTTQCCTWLRSSKVQEQCWCLRACTETVQAPPHRRVKSDQDEIFFRDVLDVTLFIFPSSRMTTTLQPLQVMWPDLKTDPIWQVAVRWCSMNSYNNNYLNLLFSSKFLAEGSARYR